MRKLSDLFSFRNLQIPGYIRREFLCESVRKNDFSLRIVCGIIFAAELFNIARVLCWSSAGLGTRNNRIYFAMYCILIVLAALWLALRRPLRRRSMRVQLAAQYTVVNLIFLWHMSLNTYDLYRDREAGVTVFTTALLALSLLIQMPPWYSAAEFAVSYGIFRATMAPLLDAGDRLNLTIAFVVALAVSLTYARHTTLALEQQKQILQMNAKLQQLAQSDPLTELLNKAATARRARQLLDGMDPSGGLTMFLLDLDEFKRINDRYGHPCGDSVLVQTADAMRRAFPDAAGLGRTGGDEFCVLYDRPLTVARAAALGQALGEQLETLSWENRPLGVRCSVGVCICTLAQCSYPQLYAETDRMLYRAKETGKGRCCVCRLEPAGADAKESPCGST